MRPRADHKLVEAVCAGFPGGEPRGHVLAAVSGGSDSVALLVLLAAARESRSFELTAVYVDHCLRAETKAEAAHVAALTADLGAGFVAATIDRPAHPSEAELRRARYAALAQTAQQRGADWIATGHTRDDQIETILFRFVRGSSRKGLGGIPSQRGHIVRPQLGLGREELRAFLMRRGIAWMEDASNAELVYARNRLRHRVIPAIEEALGAGRLAHLPEVGRVWRLEDDYLEAEAARFAAYAMRTREGRSEIDIAALALTPPALIPRVLRRWLEALGAPEEIALASLAALHRLAESPQGSARLRVGGLEILREYDRLRAAEPGAEAAGDFQLEVSIETRAVYDDPSGAWRLEVDPRPSESAPPNAGIMAQVVEITDANLAGPLLLRAHRPGDFLRINGRGTRKVRDMMIEMRVPRRVRASWPVLAAQGRIIWVPGLAVADGLESSAADRARAIRFAWNRWHV